MFLSLFFVLVLGIMHQSYHIFLCEECHILECSEFYIVAGVLMFMALGLFVLSISEQLIEENTQATQQMVYYVEKNLTGPLLFMMNKKKKQL